MPAIEGINPAQLWTFFYVLIAIGGIYLILDKVVTSIGGHIKKKREALEQGEDATNMAEEIKGDLMDIRGDMRAMKKEIETINSKLDNDNRRIGVLERGQADTHTAYSVMCTAICALLDHELHNGNADQMEDARNKLMNYLQSK